MENEIKVNEYVRMIDGLIAKIVTKDKDDHFILDRYYAGGRHLTEIEVKNDIVKHSTNLIDILEYGDYINGHKIVNEIWGEDGNNLYFEIEGGYNKARYIGENEIKKVVTKEQFEAIGYKVTKM